MKKHHLIIIWLIVSFFLSSINLINFDTVEADGTWWDTDWDSYRMITIDSDYVDTDLVNFPLLVVLDNTTGDYCFNDDGSDIAFVNLDNDTEFNHEVEVFDNGGKTFVWVNISETMTSGSDYSFLVYYNNSGASDLDYNPTGVWDSDYIAVYHMVNEQDSTVYNNDATVHGASSGGTGGIYQCYSFDGTNDYLDINVIDNDWGATPYSVESYFMIDDTNHDNDTYQGLLYLSKSHYKYLTFRRVEVLPYVEDFEIYGTYRIGTTNYFYGTGKNSITYDDWYYCAFSCDSGSQRIFLNGVLGDIGTATGTLASNTANDYIGSQTGVAEFYGKIDETRLSKVKRNDSWIKASFHSINQTTSFLTIGNEVEQPPPEIDYIENLTNCIGTHEHVYNDIDGFTIWLNYTGEFLPYVAPAGSYNKWRLVSLPRNETISKYDVRLIGYGNNYSWVDAVSNGVILSFIYNWNVTYQFYDNVDDFEGYKGYWVYFYENYNLWVDECIGNGSGNGSTVLNVTQIIQASNTFNPVSMSIGFLFAIPLVFVFRRLKFYDSKR